MAWSWYDITYMVCVVCGLCIVQANQLFMRLTDCLSVKGCEAVSRSRAVGPFFSLVRRSSVVGRRLPLLRDSTGRSTDCLCWTYLLLITCEFASLRHERHEVIPKQQR